MNFEFLEAKIPVMNDKPEDDYSTILTTELGEIPESLQKEMGERPGALVLMAGQLKTTVFDLVDKETSFGRNPDNSIVLDFGGISRHHFKVTLDQDEFVLSDAGSKNGTFLNNKKISSSVPLSKGDVIQVGDVAFKYIPKNDPERLFYDKLQWEACRDLHTGCYNKTYFNDALDLEFKKAKQTKEPLSLIFFDIDHFKAFNDNHGHDAGDTILKEMAALTRKHGINVKDDIFARYGGEEFVILLPGRNLKQAVDVAEHLRAAIEKHPFTYEEKSVSVTASFGVAEYTEQMASATELFKNADRATYQAKEKGRNSVQSFT